MNKTEWKDLDSLKWVGTDFDDVICKNSGYPNFIPLDIIPGTKEALDKLTEQGYKIILYTARPWSDYENLERFCEVHELPIRRIICGKPLFKCIIDDKNIAFKGDWKKALEDVKSFT